MTAATTTPADAIDAQFLDVCATAPYAARSALDWQNALRDAGVPDTLAHLTRVQESQPDPLPAVLALILKHESSWRGDALRDRLADHLDRFAASETGLLIDDVWRAVRDLRPLDEGLARAAAKLSPTAYEVYWFAKPPVRRDLDDAAAAVHPHAAERWRGEMLEPVDLGIPRPVFPDREGRPGEAERRFDASERSIAFQMRAVRDGRLEFRDPKTDVLVDVFDSCQVGASWQYSFGDEHLSVLLSGGGGQKAIFLYAAHSNSLFDLGSGLATSFGLSKPCISLARLLRRAAVKAADWSRAVEGRGTSAGRRRVAVVAMHAENPMHHLWNLFPACEAIALGGLSGNIDELWTTPSDFYGRLPELYPELAGAQHHDVARSGAGDPHPFSPTDLVVRVGGYFMRRSLLDRVVERMRGLEPAAGAVEPDPDDASPVIWFGLRVGSRSWLGQDEEIPHVIDRIHERHPDARIVLDGYTRAVGVDLASERWEASITQLSALATQISARVLRPERLIDLSGLTLREATLWAAVADVAVTPTGSSQHKVGWFMDGVGFMYGSEEFATRTAKGSLPGTYQAEGRADWSLITGRAAEVGERRSATDARRHLDNLVIDPEVVIERVLGALDARRIDD